MAAGTRPFIIGFLVLITTTFLLAGFVSNFLAETNPSSLVLTTQEHVLANITSGTSSLITDFQNRVNQSVNQLQGSKASPTEYLFLIVHEAFTIPKLFIGIIIDGILLISNLLFPSLGGFSTALNILLGTIILGLSISVVFYLIKTLRTGESER